MGEVSQESPQQRTRKRAKRWLLGSALLFAGTVALLVAVAMGWIVPRQYESTAVIRVTQVAEQAGRLTAAELETLMGGELRRVLAVPTIDRVGERLKLEDRWEMPLAEVREEIREAVVARPGSGAGLIEISVRRPDPEEARVLAFTVADAYRELRTAEEESRKSAVLEALDLELKKQQDKVEEKRRALQRLLEQRGPTLEEAADEAEEKQAIRRNEELTPLELEAEGRRLDGILAGLESRRGQDLYTYAAGLVLPQNTVSVVHKDYEIERSESRRLRDAGFGEAHPRVVASDIRLSMLKSDLDLAVKKMRERTEALRAHLERRKDGFPRWDGEGRAAYLEAWRFGEAFRTARDVYEEEEEVLRTLRATQSAWRTRARGQEPVVDVGGRPRSGETVYQPGRRCLMGGALAGAIVGLGGVLGAGLPMGPASRG